MVAACLKPAVPARTPSASPASPAPWTLPDLSRRLVEISAGPDAAHLTAAFGLVLDAQLAGDRAAWVTIEGSTFFPPDAADGGIDLDALPVVRVRDARMAGRAADHLARSGGFGLIVIDLSARPATHPPAHVVRRRAGDPRSTIPLPLLTRLLGLAREHDVALVLLTRKSQDSPSLHSLISLRVDARRQLRDERHDLSATAGTAKVELCIRALKDKRRGPGWTHVEICRGPAGLR